MKGVSVGTTDQGAELPEQKPGRNPWWRRLIRIVVITCLVAFIGILAVLLLWSEVSKYQKNGQGDVTIITHMQKAVQDSGWKMVVQPTRVHVDPKSGLATYEGRVQFGGCKLKVITRSNDRQNVYLRVVEQTEPIEFPIQAVSYAALEANAETYGLQQCRLPMLPASKTPE
jgi:hypothetical protein